METTRGFPWRAVLMVAFVVVTQVAGVSMLVRSGGFRDPVWTAACLGTYLVSLWVLARVISAGMALSLVMPVLAALVPLASIGVAIALFGERASAGKVGLLVLACLLIGAAARA